MIMNQDDKRRYEWLRSQFTSTGLRMDGTYLPILPVGRLPSANSLDASIDKAMGMAHDPHEAVRKSIRDGAAVVETWPEWKQNALAGRAPEEPTHEPISPADIHYQPLTEEEVKAIEDLRSQGRGKRRVDIPAGSVVFDEPLEPVFTVDEVAEMLLKNCNGYLWIGDERLELPYRDDIKAALLKMKAGE